MAVSVIGLPPAFLSDLVSFHSLPSPTSPTGLSCFPSFLPKLQTYSCLLTFAPALQPTWTGSQLQYHLPRQAFQTFLAEAESWQVPHTLRQPPLSAFNGFYDHFLSPFIQVKASGEQWRYLVHPSIPGTKNPHGTKKVLSNMWMANQ